MSGHDAELERLRRDVNCAALLERYPPPWRLDRRESTRRCLKYRRGKGEILLVTHEGRGWWDPCGPAKGDVFDLVRHLEPGLSFGQVRQVLRPLIGLSPVYPTYRRRPKEERPTVPYGVRWERRGVPFPGSPCWRYLTVERCLPEPVVRAAVRHGVLREGPKASAWFAHRDHAGRLSGIEMRGPTYRGFSPGGHKTLFRFPGQLPAGPVIRLAVAEAPIDALSLAVIEGSRADTLYVATAGGMGPETIVALELLLRELAGVPGGVLVAATDPDRAGEAYAGRLAGMAEVAGVRSERLLPPHGREDWNDVLKHERAA